jgi:hypothetical protein
MFPGNPHTNRDFINMIKGYVAGKTPGNRGILNIDKEWNKAKRRAIAVFLI